MIPRFISHIAKIIKEMQWLVDLYLKIVFVLSETGTNVGNTFERLRRKA